MFGKLSVRKANIQAYDRTAKAGHRRSVFMRKSGKTAEAQDTNVFNGARCSARRAF